MVEPPQKTTDPDIPILIFSTQGPLARPSISPRVLHPSSLPSPSDSHPWTRRTVSSNRGGRAGSLEARVKVECDRDLGLGQGMKGMDMQGRMYRTMTLWNWLVP